MDLRSEFVGDQPASMIKALIEKGIIRGGDAITCQMAVGVEIEGGKATVHPCTLLPDPHADEEDRPSGQSVLLRNAMCIAQGRGVSLLPIFEALQKNECEVLLKLTDWNFAIPKPVEPQEFYRAIIVGFFTISVAEDGLEVQIKPNGNPALRVHLITGNARMLHAGDIHTRFEMRQSVAQDLYEDAALCEDFPREELPPVYRNIWMWLVQEGEPIIQALVDGQSENASSTCREPQEELTLALA